MKWSDLLFLLNFLVYQFLKMDEFFFPTT